jgi:hypothetical protein
VTRTLVLLTAAAALAQAAPASAGPLSKVTAPDCQGTSQMFGSTKQAGTSGCQASVGDLTVSADRCEKQYTFVGYDNGVPVYREYEQECTTGTSWIGETCTSSGSAYGGEHATRYDERTCTTEFSKAGVEASHECAGTDSYDWDNGYANDDRCTDSVGTADAAATSTCDRSWESGGDYLDGCTTGTSGPVEVECHHDPYVYTEPAYVDPDVPAWGGGPGYDAEPDAPACDTP